MKTIKQQRIQALEDCNYIWKNYGIGNSHAEDDDRLKLLLISPTEETALKICIEYLSELFNIGYMTFYNDKVFLDLPLEDKRILEIKTRWNL